jgi:addiction module HigA family antidote
MEANGSCEAIVKGNTAYASTINIARASFGEVMMHTTSRLPITTNMRTVSMKIPRKGAPGWTVHPGEILREEFLKPLHMSAYELAKRLRVPVPRVNDIALERRGISADTAVRLSRFFGTTEQFWLNLQANYEVSRVRAGTPPKLN